MWLVDLLGAVKAPPLKASQIAHSSAVASSSALPLSSRASTLAPRATLCSALPTSICNLYGHHVFAPGSDSLGFLSLISCARFLACLAQSPLNTGQLCMATMAMHRSRLPSDLAIWPLWPCAMTLLLLMRRMAARDEGHFRGCDDHNYYFVRRGPHLPSGASIKLNNILFAGRCRPPAHVYTQARTRTRT